MFQNHIVDMNECDTGTFTCVTNAHCVNNDGSYYCQCNTGYTGDGNTCTGMAAQIKIISKQESLHYTCHF